jgi:hypothetical protein
VILLAWTLALAVGPVTAADAPAPEVRVQGERLTVRAEGVPVEEILRLLVVDTGAELKGGVRTPRPVSVQLDAVPIDEGLHRILGDQNFTLVFREDGRLKRLTLLGGPVAPAAPGAVAVPAAPPAPPPQTAATPLLQRIVEVPPGGGVARQLGTNSPTVGQLLELAGHTDDTAVRVEAVRYGIKGVEKEQTTREAIVASLGRMDDAQLTALLQQYAGGRSRELVAQISTMSSIPELRVRGFELLRTLPP